MKRPHLQWIMTILLIAATLASPMVAFAASPGNPTQVASLAGYDCTYSVRYGDSLSRIAARYNTTAYALASANNLYNINLIYAGMALRVPCTATTPPGPGDGAPPSGICSTYTVRPGDYVQLIALRYRVTSQAIALANRLYNPNLIYVGMRLAIPCPNTLPGGAGQWKTFTSATYHYTVNYPADWTAQVNTWVTTGPGSNPEYVTLAQSASSLPRVEIDALTGTPPFTGYENCARNFVFHNVPACKISVPAGQIPASDIWVFQRGNAYFRIVLAYKDASSAQLFNDVMTSFNFTQ